MKALYSKLFSVFVPLMLITPAAWAFDIYRTGNSADVVRSTLPMTCLAGGGSDDAWAEGWRHMMLKAHGGDVVVIRADGSRGGYEDWIYNDPDHHNFPKVNSVSTLVLESPSDSNQAEVVQLIQNAEMIFFAGGDQSEYVRIIKGTRLEVVLNQALHVRRVPFGGTSAGMAILGDIDFRARFDSPSKPDGMVTALDVMKDPTGDFVDLDRGFITASFMNQVITDTHFSQRDRQGRLVGFMARAVYNNYQNITAFNIRGIGADEDTAVCYGQSGQARVFGSNSAYFLNGNAPVERMEPGQALDWNAQGKAVKVYIIKGNQGASATFDLRTWTGAGGDAKYWFVDGTNPDQPVFGEN